MTSTRHEELIARLKAINGEADGYLEAAFLEAIFDTPATCSMGDGGGDEWHCGDLSSDQHPFYSIDSALSLVPDGYTVETHSSVPTDSDNTVMLWKHHALPKDGLDVKGRGKTLAIALCIASLRARASLKARTAQK